VKDPKEYLLLFKMTSPVYNFSNKTVYCFSDLEGYIPEVQDNAPDDVKTILNILKTFKLDKPEASAEVKLNQTLDVTLPEKTAIIFTGDLIDRGEESIRLLKGMIELKDNNRKSACLCAGNRDMNKLRMYDEFAINNGENLLFSLRDENLTTSTFFQLAKRVANEFGTTFKFKNNVGYLSPLLANTNEPIWSKIKDSESKIIWGQVFSQDLSERVQNIYEHTLVLKIILTSFSKKN